ncbi:DUF1850 domain-containing protein [Taylorella equigenitalis]|uniref:DUF1850 domain-containing protein n=1 Tax=Taylorella equigenitalis TaxID=29575 RepID=UPI0002F00FB1|nr:DUF1850 domain-containing protein [Taylorella equigenitalis]
MYQGNSCYLRDDEFSISWIHSVEKEEWIENYKAVSGNLNLKSTFFKTFGAGTPSDGEVINAPQGYVGYKINRNYPVLNWVVSQNMQGKIIVDGDVWNINKEVPRFTEIQMSSVRVPIINLLFGGFCNDK